MLILASISGIQDFLFDVRESGGGQAKSLRHRSFRIGEFAIENKTESVNRRDTGAAQHPRTVERVAPGARFTLEIAIQEFDIDGQFKYKDSDDRELTGSEALLEVVDHALWEMQQTGIGAGTGNGSGQIRIHWDGRVERCQRRSRERRIEDGSCDAGPRDS